MKISGLRLVHEESNVGNTVQCDISGKMCTTDRKFNFLRPYRAFSAAIQVQLQSVD